MSDKTKPIFAVGSVRSGTRTIFKLLSGIDEIAHDIMEKLGYTDTEV